MFDTSRRSILGAGLATSVLAGIPVARAAADDHNVPTDTDPDILFHTSFEDSTDQGWITDSSEYDASDSFSGQQCLKYTRTSRDSYTVVRRTITDFDPTVGWEMSAWVRTTEINHNPAYGAYIALEAYDESDKWLTAATSVGMVSQDWVEIKAPIFDYIPENTHHLKVALYIYRNQIGTAWFDEVAVRRPVPKILATSLEHPSYRGLLIPGEREEIALSAKIALDELAGDETMTITLTDADDTVIDVVTQAATAEIHYVHPSGALALGRHTLSVSVDAPNTPEPVASSTWDITKVGTVPSTYIDEHGRFIRDGELHFPIGFYASVVEESLPDLVGTPFNTILAYQPPVLAEMDAAHDQGVDVIYAINNYFHDTRGGYYRPKELEEAEDEVPVIIDTVNQFREHPALLAWYMSDELPIGHYGPRMIEHQQAIEDNDPDHPTYTVSPTVMDPEVYQRATDIFGIDRYPIFGLPDDEIDSVSDRAAIALDTLPGKGLMHVAQYFNWKYYGRADGIYPDRDELRSMLWQYLVLGARGLLLFQLPLMHRDPDQEFADLMTTASDVANEILARVPLMLATEEPAPVSGVVSEARWTTRRHDERDHIIVISTANASQQVSFTHAGAASIEVIDQDRTIQVEPDGTFTDDLSPLDLGIYRVVPPTYDLLLTDTDAAYERVGQPGFRGQMRRARQALRHAERITRGAVGDETTRLEEYRAILADTADWLSEDDLVRLTRLSKHLS